MEKTKKNAVLEGTLIGIKLLLICAIVAAVVAFVYELTLEKANENINRTKSEAVGAIYQLDGLTLEEKSKTDAAVIYLVSNAEKTPVGYCAEVKSAGFGGDLLVMVGYDLNAQILGVKIVEMSETPGLGSKVGEADYLSQYTGKSGELTLNEDVDAVSGATISSKALLSGVNTATKALTEFLKGGANNE